jgi:hypothetical protein
MRDLLKCIRCSIEIAAVEVGRGHLILPVKLEQRIV